MLKLKRCANSNSELRTLIFNFAVNSPDICYFCNLIDRSVWSSICTWDDTIGVHLPVEWSFTIGKYLWIFIQSGGPQSESLDWGRLSLTETLFRKHSKDLIDDYRVQQIFEQGERSIFLWCGILLIRDTLLFNEVDFIEQWYMVCWNVSLSIPIKLHTRKKECFLSEITVSSSVVCPKRESNPRFLGHNEMP